MELRCHNGIEENNGGLPTDSPPEIQQIVNAAREELQRLIQERCQIRKRIGSIKQTISGLCCLFGEDVLGADLHESADRRVGIRRPGITRACRVVLMEAGSPLTTREVCEQIQGRLVPGLESSKNLVASVNTILTRLVHYGEARTVPSENGSRAWVWVRAGDGLPHPLEAANIRASQY